MHVRRRLRRSAGNGDDVRVRATRKHELRAGDPGGHRRWPLCRRQIGRWLHASLPPRERRDAADFIGGHLRGEGGPLLRSDHGFNGADLRGGALRGQPLSLDCGVRRRELSRLLPFRELGICPTTVAKGASCAAANLVCAAGELVRPRQHRALRGDRRQRRRLQCRLRVHGRVLPEANSECLHLHDRRGQFLARDLRRHVLTRSVYPQVAVLGWRRDHHLARAFD